FFVFFLFLLSPSRRLHSFPTRRSSDLRDGDRDDRHLRGLVANRLRGQRWERSRSTIGSGISPTASRTCPREAWPMNSFGRPKRRSEEHTSELQSRFDLVCRLLLEKKKG